MTYHEGPGSLHCSSLVVHRWVWVWNFSGLLKNWEKQGLETTQRTISKHASYVTQDANKIKNMCSKRNKQKTTKTQMRVRVCVCVRARFFPHWCSCYVCVLCLCVLCVFVCVSVHGRWHVLLPTGPPQCLQKKVCVCARTRASQVHFIIFEHVRMCAYVCVLAFLEKHFVCVSLNRAACVFQAPKPVFEL
jgi:hypothetical protein